jgi:hypothetical protein
MPEWRKDVLSIKCILCVSIFVYNICLSWGTCLHITTQSTLTSKRKYIHAQIGLRTHVRGDKSAEDRKTSVLKAARSPCIAWIYLFVLVWINLVRDSVIYIRLRVPEIEISRTWQSNCEIRFRLLQQAWRIETSVLPVCSSCLVLDAYIKEQNVKLVSVYIECCLQFHDTLRQFVSCARTAQLFAQLLLDKGLIWSIHMFRKYCCVSVFKLSSPGIDRTDHWCSRYVLYSRTLSTFFVIRVETVFNLIKRHLVRPLGRKINACAEKHTT